LKIAKASFGTVNRKEVTIFTLTNQHNMTVKIINYGATITSVSVPDRKGKSADVVLGFNTLKEYQQEHPYIGAVVGRYGNRIAKGRFVLNGQEYKLAVNDGENHLHGGLVGFDKVVWEGKEFKNQDGIGVELTYLSTEGEEGYPGNLRTTVRYLLNNQNELVINYLASTDQTTVVNLTQHSYFNLKGEGCGDILGHELLLNAELYTEVDEGLIPTGALKPVKGTPLDFTTMKPMGAEIKELSVGYDHNFVINHKGKEPALTAKVCEPETGRVMEVFTTEPGVQFYTGNFLDGALTGKSGSNYEKHSGFCLETQHFPDSPNHSEFPSTTLNPGEVYKQTTIYKFSVL